MKFRFDSHESESYAKTHSLAPACGGEGWGEGVFSQDSPAFSHNSDALLQKKKTPSPGLRPPSPPKTGARVDMKARFGSHESDG